MTNTNDANTRKLGGLTREEAHEMLSVTYFTPRHTGFLDALIAMTDAKGAEATGRVLAEFMTDDEEIRKSRAASFVEYFKSTKGDGHPGA